MSRRDAYLDAMLRNLGAAYYQTTKGTARAADVTRALESVAAEDARRRGSEHGNGTEPGQGAVRRGHHRGHWRVRDVMTTQVVTVGTFTPYKEVARLMTEHRVNAMPVVAKSGKVIGMVSEADALRKQERNFRRLGLGMPWRSHRDQLRAAARTVGDLMTAPAITIHDTALLGYAARLMNGNNIRRLPVVDDTGKLIGIVSRRDILSVFLRPDEDIAAEVHDVISSIVLADGDAISVSVRDGVVTLSGSPAGPDQISVAVKLASDVDGVVTVINKLAGRATAPSASVN